jgi:ribosomal protein L31E
MATRVLTIGIRNYLVGKSRTKRRASAVKFIKDRIAHATKTDVENVKLSMSLNNAIIKRYSKYMVPVKVSLNIDNGKVNATPFSEQKPVEPAKPEAAKKGTGASEAALPAAAQTVAAPSAVKPAPTEAKK